MRIRFGCGLDSRIYGTLVTLNWKAAAKQWPWFISGTVILIILYAGQKIVRSIIHGGHFPRRKSNLRRSKIRSCRHVNCFFFFVPFSCQGLPDLPPPTSDIPYSRHPHPYLEQIYGIPPKSILPPIPKPSHRPSSSERSSHYCAGDRRTIHPYYVASPL